MILIIDGHSVSYRIFYKTPPLSNSKGEPTSVLHSFLNLILTLKEKLKPDKIFVVFDSKGETERHKMHKDYKATREKTPEDLLPQIERLKEILPLMGVTVVYKEATEADDIIYTLSKKYDEDIYIITKDKDIFQLVNDRIKIYDYQNDELYDREKVFEKFGVYPEQIADYLALCGDSSDNIPGVKGVGAKTAVKLIKEFGSLEAIYENIEKVKGKLKEKLLAGRDDAFFSKKLVELAVVDKVNFENKPDELKLKELLQYLELKTVLKRVFPTTDADDTDDFKNLEDLLVALDGALYCLRDSFFRIQDCEGNFRYFFDVKGILKFKRLNSEDELFDLKIVSWMNDPDEGVIKKHKEESVEEFVKRVSAVSKEQVERLKELKLDNLYNEIEKKIIFILREMEDNGIKINGNKILEIAKDLDKKLLDIEQKIFRFCGITFNLNSPKQLSEILFEKLGLKPVKKTKTGYSTSEEALKELIVQNPNFKDIIEWILEYRELKKLRSTYTENLLKYADENGRIHTEFNQTGTATGRISSTNPNLQNIPISSSGGKLIRSCFEAEEGFSFVSFDYSQIELRILAHLSGAAKLIEAFHNNEDIHTKTAKEIFEVNRVDSKLRRIAKAVNFGIVYGLSPFGLARDTGISQKDAKSFIEKYFHLYPEVKEYIENVIKFAEKHGYTETILGRKRFIKNINSKNKYQKQRAERIAINAPVQGSAADIIKLAMIKISNYLQNIKPDVKMILQIHDELIFEVKEELVDNFVKNGRDIMENVIDLKVPLSVNVSTGKTWGDLK